MIKTKFYENDKLIKFIFRALAVMIVISGMVQLILMPREDDRYFVKNGNNKPVTEEELLYSGTFDWVLENGDRVSGITPGTYDVAAGHTMVVESRIPDNYNSSAIIVRASQQNLRIYIDGVLRVDYDTASSRPYGSQTTSRYVICDTDSKDAGALLRIETYSEAEAYSGVFNQVYACDKYDFWSFIF